MRAQVFALTRPAAPCWAQRRATAWSWIKFLTLMFCVGALPFTPEAPFAFLFPVAVIALTVAFLAAASLWREHARSVLRWITPITDPPAAPALAAALVSFTFPAAPGVSGSIRARAPSRVMHAR